MTDCKNTFFNMSLQGTLIREAIQKKSIVKQKAFTLAEILIVLSVIAVLTAILLPVAQKAMVNKKVVKFQKAHETVFKVVSEMTNGDYFLNGDLGIKIDGTLLDGSHEGDTKYFCEVMSNLLESEEKTCDEHGELHSEAYVVAKPSALLKSNGADIHCLHRQKNSCTLNYKYASKIISPDNIYFYEANTKMVFGHLNDQNKRFFKPELGDESGNWRVLCVDIDGWCKEEDPFGYYLSVDGKLLPSKRTSEWLERGIQDKD